MSNLVKTQKNKLSKSNKTSTKIMLMGSLSALLAACGGGTTAPTGSKTPAPKSGPADPKSDPNAKVADDKAVNVIRANDGSEAQTGKSGEDVFIVVGAKTGADYTIEDIKTVNGISTDLSAYISADDINQAVIADLSKGGSLDGAEDGAVLVIFGKVDLSATELKNIHKIIVKGETTLDHAQISADLKDIMGEASSVLAIKDSENAVEVNLSNVILDGITKLEIGANVTVRMTNDQVLSLKEINGSGAFENVFKDQMLKVAHLEKQDAKANSGTDADDKLNGTDQNDDLKGFDGDDVLNAGAGEDTLDGGTGDDILIDDDEAADTFLGGDGNDYFVVLGSAGAKTYTDADLNNPFGLDLDLRDVIDVQDFAKMGNNNVFADNHYDGGADGAHLLVYGNLDVTNFTLKNIDNITIFEELAITADQLNALSGNVSGSGNVVGASQTGANTSRLSKISASDDGKLVIKASGNGTSTEVNISSIDLGNVKEITVAENVNLLISQTQLDSLDKISGEGEISNSEKDSELNFNNVQLAASISQKALLEGSITGKLEVDETLSLNIIQILDGNGVSNAQNAYQWYRDGEAIDGATSINYVVTDEDIGSEIHATIKFQDDAGYDETLTFAKTDVVHLPNLFDIDKTPDALMKDIIAPANHSDFGAKFYNIGDMNGDGYDDFVFSGRTIDTETSGFYYKAFVAFGDKDGKLDDINFDQLDGSNGFIIEYSDTSKHVISHFGDYNGDGLSDLIIKSTFVNDSTDTETLINPNYVIWGQKDGFDTNIKLNEAIEGKIEKYYDRINDDTKSIYHEIATFNDFNGDGYNDLVAIIEDRDFDGEMRPNITLKFGGDAMLTESDSFRNTDNDNSVRISGSNSHNFYTQNLAGDINGDGFDDLIVHRIEKGTYKLDAAVIFGTDENLYEQFFNKPDALDALNGQDGFTIKQDAAHARGLVGNSHGDFNGDGYNDLIFRTRKFDDDNTDNGFYILYGKKDGFSDNYNLSDIKDDHGLQLTTKTKDFIQGVENAGDVNGDGLDDLILKAVNKKQTVDGTIHNGKAYIIYGQKNGDVTNFDLENLEEDQGVTLYQSSAVDNKLFVSNFESAGDVNHDGYDDIFIRNNIYKTDEATGRNYNESETKIFYGGDHLSNPNMAAAKDNDLVEGTAGDDALLGGLGDDVLKGAAGDDSLRGGNGDDLLDGGAGRDLLKGGGGADIFKFAAGDSNIEITGSGENGHIKGFDIIRDFETNKVDMFGEKIVIEGGAIIAADATVDGNDSTLTIKDGNKGDASTIKSHKIEDGVITFDNEDQYSEAIDIASFGGISAVIEYLQNQDLGDAGTSVVFDNGANSYLFVQGDDNGTNDQDVVVRLDNVQVDSLIDEAAYGYQDLLIA